MLQLSQTQVKITPKEKSAIDCEITIPVDALNEYRTNAIQELGKDLEMKGFRKGHVPSEMAEKIIGELKILEEMALMGVTDVYPQILSEHKIDALGRPNLSFSKLAPNNDVVCILTTAVVPTVQLPDYKKISQKVFSSTDEVTVADEELDHAITSIQKMRAQQQAVEQGIDPKTAKDAEIQPLDDAYVQSLGKFTDVADFTQKLRENLMQEKQAKEEEKKLIALSDELVEKTKVDVPEVLTDHELQKMTAQIEHDIAMTGMKFEDYMKNIGKTREILMKEWHEPAEKRAKMNLIIDAIAKAEKLSPTADEVENEAQAVLQRYQDQKNIDPNNVRAYVASVLTNQKVFEFLKNQGK